VGYNITRPIGQRTSARWILSSWSRFFKFALYVFSKKIENLEHAVALHFMHYNFARPHKTLSAPYPITPAMAVGISDHIWSIEEIVKLAD
jgi:hypothetical protein